MGEKHTKGFLFTAVFLLLVSLSIFAQNEAQPPASNDVYKKVIYYIMQDSRDLYQIGLMDLDGKNKKLLTKEGNNWCPSISPAGDRVAFYSDRSGFANLWIMDAGGGNLKQITDDKDDIIKIDLYNRGQIGWEKEGDQIYFLKKGDIWQVDKTGDTPSTITKFHDITGFKMSPDGKRFVFSREKTKRHNGMWTMNNNGTGARQVAESMIINPSFDWGDNNTIVYFHNRGISAVSYIGTDRKFLKETFYLDNDIAWAKASPDRKNNLIAYISDAKNGPNIWTMNWDGSNEKQVTEKGGFSPFWTPDGAFIIYVEENDIFRIDAVSREKVRLSYFFRSYYPVQAEIKIEGAPQPAAAEKNGGEADAGKK
jgi:Tol biopolymer transport system component